MLALRDMRLREVGTNPDLMVLRLLCDGRDQLSKAQGNAVGLDLQPHRSKVDHSPPVTAISLPVTYDASGEISHDTVAAISSGWGGA